MSKQIDRAPYLEPAEDGQKVGRLPGKVELETLRTLGHPESPIKAIRAKCLDCSGGAQSEARRCTAIKCPLWPFRMGVNVFYGRSASAEAAGCPE
jgi:hypothetical protein